MYKKLTLFGDKGYPLYVLHMSPMCPSDEYFKLKNAVEWRTCFSFHRGIDQLTLVGDGYRVFKLNWEWISRMEAYK